MIIYDIREKGKFWLFWPLSIILIISFIFGAGKLVILEKETQPVTLEYATSTENVLHEPQPPPDQKPALQKENNALQSIRAGAYIASKFGKAYYLPWCAAAKRISDKNKVWFATRAQAEQAGYKPAPNCKGLK